MPDHIRARQRWSDPSSRPTGLVTRNRLALSPPLAPEDAAFVAGFAPRLVSAAARSCTSTVPDPGARELPLVTRVWPGQPLGPCPWVPCLDGCCLVLVCASCAALESAASWLRFLLVTILGGPGEGTVEIGRGDVVERVLVIEDGAVFEGYVESPAGWPW